MTKKTLSEEDSALFKQAIGEVKKMSSDKLLLTPDKKPKPHPKKESPSIKESFNNAVDTDIEMLYQEDNLCFVAPGLQKNVLKKLRKGHFDLDASIDLHGLNSQEAKHQLSRFLHFSLEDGCRCVHIIHGKGYRSPDQKPVLKNNINLWLRQHSFVQAFCSTPPKKGGTGAVFVLLKLSEKYDNEENT